MCFTFWDIASYKCLWFEMHTTSGHMLPHPLKYSLLQSGTLIVPSAGCLKLCQACSFYIVWHVIPWFGVYSYTSLLLSRPTFWCDVMWESMLVGKPLVSSEIVMLSEDHWVKRENSHRIKHLLPECILAQCNQLPTNGYVISLRDSAILGTKNWSLFFWQVGPLAAALLDQV